MLPTNLFAPLRRGCAAVAAGLLLASCGGGETVVDPFVPTRVLAFGDELSTIEADGRKHSINAFKQTTAANGTVTESTTELDCTRNPVWTQSVATSFGLPFDRCLGTATEARSQMLARAGQKVADLAAQIAAVQGAALNEDDLALVMLGMHDVLELYAQYPTRTRAELVAAAEARGVALGQQINALALRGPAVVVLTTLDLGLTPFALNENTTTGDNTRAALLTQLTAALNDSMSVTLINDGRLIGLGLPDIDLQTVVKFPSSFAFTNVVGAACRADAPLPGCTTATLATDATATGWLWADNLRPGPVMQSRMAAAAETRARTNPF
jgi:phospholipase/lecithinase/hemolysin